MHRSRCHSAIRAALTFALGFALTIAASFTWAGPLFVPQYSPSPNDGFNDPTLGPARRAVLEFTLGLWSTWLVPVYAGQTIIVAVDSIPLTGGTLAEGGPADIYRVGSDLNRVTPLANNFYRRDTNPGQPEIYVDFDLNTDFYLGFDGQTPTNRYDFVTTALHASEKTSPLPPKTSGKTHTETRLRDNPWPTAAGSLRDADAPEFRGRRPSRNECADSG